MSSWFPDTTIVVFVQVFDGVGTAGPYGEYSVSNAPQMAGTTLRNPSVVNAYTLLARRRPSGLRNYSGMSGSEGDSDWVKL